MHIATWLPQHELFICVFGFSGVAIGLGPHSPCTTTVSLVSPTGRGDVVYIVQQHASPLGGWGGEGEEDASRYSRHTRQTTANVGVLSSSDHSHEERDDKTSPEDLYSTYILNEGIQCRIIWLSNILGHEGRSPDQMFIAITISNNKKKLSSLQRSAT